MDVLWAALYLAGILAAGDVVARRLPGKAPGGAVEALATRYLAGTGLFLLILLDAQIAGVAITRGFVAALVAIAIAAAMGLRAWRGGRESAGPDAVPVPAVPGPAAVGLAAPGLAAMEPAVPGGEKLGARWVAAVAIAVILGGFAASTWFRFTMPLTGDAARFWELKGVLLYHEGLRSAAFFAPERVHFHKGYPIGIPLLEAGLYALRGTSEGVAGRVLFAGFHLALLGMLFGEARRRVSRAKAWLATGILAAAPLFLLDVIEAHVDLPLAAFHLAMAVFLLRWIDGARAVHLVAALAAGAFAALVKQEGLAYLAVASAVAAAACVKAAIAARRMRGEVRRRLGGLAVAVTVAAAVVLPWIVFERTIPRQDEDYVSRFSLGLVGQNLDRVPAILGFYGIEALNAARWGPVWLLILGATAASIAGRIRGKDVALPWAAIALVGGSLGAVTVAYVLAPANVEWLLIVSLWRIYLHVAGAGMLIAVAVGMGGGCGSRVSGPPREAAPGAAARTRPRGDPRRGSGGDSCRR